MKNKQLKVILFLFLGFGIGQVQTADEGKGDDWDLVEVEGDHVEAYPQAYLNVKSNESLGVVDVGEYHTQRKRYSASIIDKGLNVYGVFDGHHGYQDETFSPLARNRSFSTYAAEKFAQFFNKANGDLNKTFDLLEDGAEGEQVLSGTGAVVALVQPEKQKIVVANTGLSVAFLGYRGKVIEFTADQGVAAPDELNRVQRAGNNFWTFESKDEKKRLIQTWRSLGNFVMKDQLKKQYGQSALIHEPEIYEWYFRSGAVLVLGCNEMWRGIAEGYKEVSRRNTAERVAYLINEHPDLSADYLAKMLAERAFESLQKLDKEAKVSDDPDEISVVVVKFGEKDRDQHQKRQRERRAAEQFERELNEREKNVRDWRDREQRQRQQEEENQARFKAQELYKQEQELYEQQGKNQARFKAGRLQFPEGVFDIGEFNHLGGLLKMKNESFIDNSLALYGVFAGHRGNEFATYAAQNFASFFKKEGGILGKTFDLLESNGRQREVKAGTAAIVVHVEPKAQQVVIANTGDSRAILVNGNQLKQFTNDQKIKRPDENERIKKTGNSIKEWGVEGEYDSYGEKYYPQSEYYIGRSEFYIGRVAMSRILGDFHLKDYLKKTHGDLALIHTPELYEWSYESGDILILGSSEFWFCMSNEQVVELVVRYPDYNASELSKKLVENALFNKALFKKREKVLFKEKEQVWVNEANKGLVNEANEALALVKEANKQKIEKAEANEVMAKKAEAKKALVLVKEANQAMVKEANQAMVKEAKLKESLFKKELDKETSDNVSVLVVKLNVPARRGAIRGRLQEGAQMLRSLGAKNQVLKDLVPFPTLPKKPAQSAAEE